VTRGKFLSMISSATHPRWPLQPPSWIWFPLIFRRSDFLLVHWGDWSKVPFYDQHRRSSNMATTVAILDLDSVDYLMNACVNWSRFFCGSLGVLNLHHIPLLPKPYLPYTHIQLPPLGGGGAYATSCVTLVCWVVVGAKVAHSWPWNGGILKLTGFSKDLKNWDWSASISKQMGN
jgi:hypothetical protein